MSSSMMDTHVWDAPLIIAGRALRSRLMVGTGKYRSNAQMVDAIEASGAEVVTVAVRRVDLDRSKEEGVLHHLDPSGTSSSRTPPGATPPRRRCATRGSGGPRGCRTG
jgi:thiazole synthase ThiGH ThiG subunit